MHPNTSNPGDWLSAPGEYRDLVHQLCASDPRLKRRDPKAAGKHIPWSNVPGKVVMLAGESNDTGFKQPVTYGTPQALKEHLETRSPDTVNRIYILEGQNPDLIASLGGYFRMHPSFFLDHERVDVIAQGAARESDAMTLPSMALNQEHFCIKYFELVSLPASLRGTFWLQCAISGRHIGVTRIMGSFLDIGVVRRKCSVWRRRRSDSNGPWDCVIITDPPLRVVQRDDLSNHVITPSPFRGGYPDFMPHEVQMKTKAGGPTRASLLEDLCFYLEHYSSLLDLTDADSVAVVAQKIAASHYHQLHDFVRSVVSSTQWRLSRQDNLDCFDAGQAEAQWSDTQALERRLAEYYEELECTMIQCRIALQELDVEHDGSWKDVGADFQFLYMRFKDLRRRVEGLNSAITALTSLAAARQALKSQDVALTEAKNTKVLTFLGLVFIPLAYTAAMFSMAEPYAPGGEKFWQYFAISFPLIVLVGSLYYLIGQGLSMM
ncbi:hypothetical protein PG984_008326 [Apiospora sp. TS-2023a]